MTEKYGEWATLLVNDGFAMAKEFGDVEIYELVPPELMGYVCRLIFIERTLERKHFKSVLSRWLLGEPLPTILADPKYEKADDSAVDAAVEEVYSENRDKFDGTDKMVNWLVGQVMKKTQGKADASLVKDRIKKLCVNP